VDAKTPNAIESSLQKALMLSQLVGFSIRRPRIVAALAFLLLVYGVYSLHVARLDVFPEFAPPLAVVQTDAPGLSPEQVEVLVTQPIENALGGTLGVDKMKSKSLQGLSLVTLTFADATDVQQARQLATERLSALASQLPVGVKPPALLPLTSSTSVVLVVGLTSRTRSVGDLYDFAQWTLKPHLMGLQGVADAVVFGGENRQFQVQVDPQRLAEAGLSLQDVIDAAKGSTGVRAAGVVEGTNQRLDIRTEGQISSPEQLAQTTLRLRSGGVVRLADVADVHLAPQTPVGAASIRGVPGVMLVIESQYGADPMAVTRAIDQSLSGLKPILAAEDVTLEPSVFRPANFISVAVNHLRNALLIGGVLVVVILFLFLFNMRTAAISATAIPLSLLTAVIVLNRLGVSLNTMTLGGLAIALGEVVDDAIVDVENIFRRLRENAALDQPLPAARVILSASLEVRSAVVYATFIVALVFLPILTLSGVAGKLFAPLGLTYILAVLASLGIALTLTPALALLLLGRDKLWATDTRFVKWIKTRYLRLLGSVERRSTAVMVIVGALCIVALGTVPLLTGSFIPELKEGHFTVHLALAPGTSLTESMRVGNRISVALAAVPGVGLVAQRAGRATDVVDPAGVNVSEFEVDLQPMSGKAQGATLDKIRRTLVGFTGATTSVNTFLTERIDETISGSAAPVIVNVYGDDLDVLDSKAREIMEILQAVPGTVGVSLQTPPGAPQLTVRLRRSQLARYALSAADVLDTVQAAFEGIEVAQVYAGNRVVDVTVILDPSHRRTPGDVGSVLLRNPQGSAVALREVADIVQSPGRSQIEHSGGQRLQTVTSGVRGRAVGDVVRDATVRIAHDVSLPKGTYVVFTGEAQARARSQRDLLVNGALAGAGVVLLLAIALNSARSTALVLLNLPFALVGGIATVLLTGAELSLGSLIGFVTLFGITLRNSIMLISHYKHLVAQQGLVWNAETARLGASERVVPILMTAAVTALGLLPLALLSGEPGNEIEGPMAIVILGGLVTSTLLNLLVLPAMAVRFGRFATAGPDLKVPEGAGN
jgi:CzcA family heavy metal efflux pump